VQAWHPRRSFQFQNNDLGNHHPTIRFSLAQIETNFATANYARPSTYCAKSIPAMAMQSLSATLTWATPVKADVSKLWNVQSWRGTDKNSLE
jgi:hypothetical protein